MIQMFAFLANTFTYSTETSDLCVEIAIELHSANMHTIPVEQKIYITCVSGATKLIKMTTKRKKKNILST